MIIKKGWRKMLSPVAIKLIRMMPEGIIIKIAKKIVDNYIRK